MIRTNKERLVMFSVQGRVHHPTVGGNGVYRIGHEGTSRVLPGVGGICYNVKVGDSVFGKEWDHVEPGVSLKNADERENAALNTFACVGNLARVVSGDAKGAEGFVTGTHGGIEHVLTYFPADALEKMVPEDKVLIKACGQGLRLPDYPDVRVMNLDPELFEKLGVTAEGDKLRVPVAAVVPAYLMGSGIGAGNAYSGDYDIMTADKEELRRHGLEALRFGDIVFLENCDTSFGRGYLGGAGTVGVVVHSDCTIMGHGPGVTTLMTCKTPLLEPVLTPGANLADYMNV